MRKTLRTVALCAAIGLLAVGCQKEVLQYPVSDMAEGQNMFSYSINGETKTECVTEEGRTELINYLFDLAEQGYRVTFNGRNTSVFSAKDVVTYSTSDRSAAVAWCDKMINDGYEVEVTYDRDKGIYTCIATK
ncbi:MAG: hypothetical protein IKC19_01670 [Bacteroidales bacterium]|nr:hypothetical protein [Bacteroidales bacterium]